MDFFVSFFFPTIRATRFLHLPFGDAFLTEEAIALFTRDDILWDLRANCTLEFSRRCLALSNSLLRIKANHFILDLIDHHHYL